MATSMKFRTPTRLPAHVAGELLAMSSNRCPACGGLGRVYAGGTAKHADQPCRCASAAIFRACRDFHSEGAASPEWRLRYHELAKGRTEAQAGSLMHREGLFNDVVYAERPAMDLAA